MARDPNIEAIYPLSPLQQGMLFHLLAEGSGSGTYFRQTLWDLPHEVDAPSLRRAWEMVVERHPALRTAFVWRDLEEPLQVVRKAVPLRWEEVDWSDIPAVDLEIRQEEWLREDRRRGFELHRAPLLRLTLIHTAFGVRLVWSFVQLLLDGWSRRLLLEEVLACYQAELRGVPLELSPALPYRDYISWLHRADVSSSEAYWRRTLEGFREPVPLAPEKRGGPSASASGHEQRVRHLTEGETAALRELVREQRSTLSTLVLGSWVLVLGRHNGRTDLVIGAVVSGRSAPIPGIESMVGVFINTLPLRLRVPPALGVLPWLRELHQRQLEMREHEHSPLLDIQKWSEVPAGTPLFETVAVLQNLLSLADLQAEEESGAAAIRERESFEQTNYPLELSALPGRRLGLALSFARTRYDRMSAGRLLEQLATVLASLPAARNARLCDLPSLPAAERHQLVFEWSDGGVAGGAEELVHEIFTEQARRQPAALALEAPDGNWTYGELERRSNQIAGFLRSLGILAETPVGLCLERSRDLAAGMLGIWKAGGVLLPLDPELPPDRLAHMLHDVGGMPVILTEESLAGRLSGLIPAGTRLACLDGNEEVSSQQPDRSPDVAVAEDQLAYLIFTSGSTGRPKAVAVPHARLRDVLHAARRRFAWPAGARTLCLAHFSFDIFLFELLNPLLSGGCGVLFPLRPALDLPRLLDVLAGVDVIHAVPALMRQVIDAAEREGRAPCRDVRAVFVGGDSVPADLLPRLREVFPAAALRVLYGPTESTIICSSHAVVDGVPPEPLLGRPLPGARILLLDPDLSAVPIGGEGEICIGGGGVARGYLGHPEMTAEKFVPDPFATEPGARLYRSGDLGRHRTDGTLEFLGRADRQVKLRGFRIELGEIEAALAALPGVGAAVVMAREDEPGERRLVAFVVPGPAGAPVTSMLRQSLRERLPEPMIPAAFVILPSFPLTPHGKVDLRALSKVEQGAATTPAVAPRTPVEEVVAALWSEALRVEQVGARDSFFDLGGHSLLAIRVSSRLSQAFGVEVSLRDLFDEPTVAGLAARIEGRLRIGDAVAPPPLAPVPRDRPLPLSFAQQRLWFLDQLEPGQTLYNIPNALRLHGLLDAGALARAFGEVARRHEVLRTCIASRDGEASQVILPLAPVELPIVDLSALGDLREETLQSIAVEAAARPFSLEEGPLWRVSLLRLGAKDHVIVLILHHIVGDGWSMDILRSEVSRLYSALVQKSPEPIPELPVQYADFAEWQRGWLRGEALERELAWWRDRLAGMPEDLVLPIDRPRPAVLSARGGMRSLCLGARLTGRLQALGRSQGATLFMTALAGFQTLLGRSGSQEDVRVGTPVAGRSRIELQGLIGLFVNTLVLRARLSGVLSFRRLLGQIREEALGGFVHQELPFDLLVDDLQPQRDPSRTPLFDVMFSLQGAPGEAAPMAGLEVRGLPLDLPVAKFDLAVTIFPTDADLEVLLVYRADLFDGTTADRLLRCYANLLEGAVEQPDLPWTELPLLRDEERHQLLLAWNDTRRTGEEPPLVSARIAAWSAAAPGALAIRAEEEETLTFRELDRRACRLARHLRSRGVGPETRVGILLERSAGLVVAILAVFKAGGAYVPLDPELPVERLRFLTADSGVRTVITLERWRALLPESPIELVRLDTEAEVLARHPADPLATSPDPRHLAYMIYTSGTTGAPKAVQVEQRSLAAVLEASRDRFGWSAEDRLLALAPFSFDIFLFELFGPLTAGGSCRLFPTRPLPDLERLVAELESCTVLHAVPSLMRQIVDEVLAQDGRSERLLCVRAVFVGGDAVPPGLLEDLRRAFPAARIRVLYGPTEATVICASHDLVPGERVERPLIGRSLPGSELFVTDRFGALVPQGSPGEIRIGGEGVTRGYHHRPDLTAERFVPNPFAAARGERLYRSGDLARWRADGTLEFLGRTDQQVKIRGFRVELGEVEAALSQLPGVRQGVVAVRADETGERRLVAYVAAGEENTLSPAELRASLGRILPEPMVPSAFVLLAALPLTPHGKVDRRALPEPVPGEGRREGTFVAPETPAERALAEIWAQLLRVERVGLNDDFFSLGGDSILSIQVVARARRAGLFLTPKQMFQQPTVAALARLATAAAAVASPPRQWEIGEAPLTPVQRELFALRLENPSHFNQAVLLAVDPPVRIEALRQALSAVASHHDALRLRFRRDGGEWRQLHAAEALDPFRHVDLSALPEPLVRDALEAAAEMVQRSLDLEHGPLQRAVLFETTAESPARLLWVIHHLVVDGVSWRILLEDLETAYEQGIQGEPVRLPPRTTSFREWAERLAAHARSDALTAQSGTWLSPARSEVLPLPADLPPTSRPIRLAGVVPVTLSASETRALLQEVPPVYRTRINDVLLAAVAWTLVRWSGAPAVLVDVEGHGREEIFPDVDLSRTVGWFTTVYPVLLEIRLDEGAGEILKHVKERLRQVPNQGLGYGLLRWLGTPEIAASLRAQPQAEVAFNYLGQLDGALSLESRFAPAAESPGATLGSAVPATHLLRIDGGVRGGCLQMGWAYSERLSRATAERLASGFLDALRALLEHCRRPDAGGFTPSDFPLARLDAARLDLLLGADRSVEDVYPLSPLQSGLLFHALYAPGSEAYFEQLSVELQGDLRAEAFRRACQRVMERHQILRAAFAWKGLDEPLHVVRRGLLLPWQELDWRGVPPEAQAERLEELLAADRRSGFDPEGAPLLRVHLVRLSERRWRLVWSNHHLLLDGWCLGIVVREVLDLYESFVQGREARLDEPRPFRDYIAWLQRQDLERAERYWRGELAGLTEPTDIGLRPLLGGGRSGVSSREIAAEFGGAAAGRLFSLARRHRLTPSTIVHGAWALLLAVYSGARDVLFGTVVSGRPPELEGVESMVGLFINTLPVRVGVDPAQETLGWLEELQSRLVEQRQLEHSPLPMIQSWSGIPAGVPLFETLLVFENYPVSTSMGHGEGGSLRVTDSRAVEQTHYPINLVVGVGDSFRLKLLFDAQRLDPATGRRMLEHLRILLGQMAERPDRRLEELSVLSDAERHLVLREWSTGPARPSSINRLDELFVRQAERTPERPAVVHGAAMVSYRELRASAGALADDLRRLGVGPEVRVGICLDRSIPLVAALLGVLAAGGAYVPLDPAYPRERLAWVLEDAEVSLVLTRADLLPILPAMRPRTLLLTSEGAIEGEVSGEADTGDAPDRGLAYVIYTSGSTGRPKGVAIDHRSAAALIGWAAEVFSCADLSGVFAATSICFDLSVFEIFVPLSLGGTVILGEDALALAGLPELPAGVVVTLVNTVPSAWTELLRLGAVPPTVRIVNLAGEPLRGALAERTYAAGSVERLYNLYGPSEDTTYSTGCLVPRTAGHEPTIGRPIASSRALVLDRELCPVPPGVAGELCLGGEGVARGYLRRPELTAERFVPDPFHPGERLYRTGDRARWRLDGDLELLGRLDHQVKIRGYRIEPGEIEAALAARPEIREAAVVPREDRPGELRLVAYVVAREGAAVSGSALREALRARLPEFMVPAAFVALDTLPRTPNGKLERSALPAPEASAAAGEAAPRDPADEMLAGIWSEILGVQRIGLDDDFFALGGHSLLATQLISRVRTVFGIDLPLRDVFEHPTVAKLASRVEKLCTPEPRMAALRPIARLSRAAYRVPRSRLRGGGAATGDRSEEVFAFPPSFSQERLWLLDQLEPGNAAYNILHGLRLEGDFDVAALRSTLNELSRRHETLRTGFAKLEDQLVQVVEPALEIPLPCVDLSGLSEALRELELAQLARREAERPFDLGTAPLLRVLLVRLAEASHAALFSIHHIVSDAWSMGIVVREVAALYGAFASRVPSPLPQPTLQYADYATWQRQWLQGEVLEESLAYWKQRLTGEPPELPLGRRRSGVPAKRTGARRFCVLPAALAQGVRKLAQRESATLFMTLLAAFQVFLRAVTGENDISLGTAIANRNRAETESLVGFFINILVFRADLSAFTTFREHLRRTREEALGAYARQDLPFNLLVQELGAGRGSANPLFQVSFGVQNARTESLSLPGLELQSIDFENDLVRYDLAIWMAEVGGDLTAQWTFDTGILDDEAVRWMEEGFEGVLAAVVRDPEISLDELERAAGGARRRSEQARTRDRAKLQKLFQREPRAVPVHEGTSWKTQGERYDG